MEIVATGAFDNTKFKIACLQKGVSLNEIAAKLGISYASLYRCVRSGGEFTRTQIQILCEIFGTELAMSFLYSE